jgi:hypothetical protein
VGPAVETWPEGSGDNRRMVHHQGRDQGGAGGESFRSSINIMEICYISAGSPPWNCRQRHGFLRAECQCLLAETENLPAEKLLCQRDRKS